MKIAHLAFNVTDMEASLRYYRDGLGFTDAFQLQHPVTGKDWIRYLKVAPGQFIELFYGYEGGAAAGSYAHLCLEVEDIHATARLIRDKGLPLDSEPKQGSDLNWQCWSHDPDGNRIEFMQIDPQSPQSRA